MGWARYVIGNGMVGKAAFIQVQFIDHIVSADAVHIIHCQAQENFRCLSKV